MPRRLAVLPWLLACALNAAAVEVVDDRGVHVRVDPPPHRIVSMLPALTETVCALGACDRLVGVDDFSAWPAQVARLPHVGGLDDTRVEAVLALKPDLILAPTSSRALPRLQALGLPVIAIEPRTMRDVKRMIGVLGPVLAAPDAEAVWRRIEAEVEAVARRMPPQLRGTRVYIEVSSTLYAASAGSFIGELLSRIGASNIVPASLGPFPKLNPEFVVRADPQVIIVGRSDAAGLGSRPGWDRIAAIRSGRICAMDSEQENVLVRAGPRLGEAAALLAECLEGKLSKGSARR
jgi:iron complex transport system substrate-binding protein